MVREDKEGMGEREREKEGEICIDSERERERVSERLRKIYKEVERVVSDAGCTDHTSVVREI